MAYSKRNAVIVDGAKLSDIRIKADLNLLDIAKLLGTGKGSVSKWEMGTLIPSEERIKKLVEILETNEFVKVNPNYRPRPKRKPGKRRK